MLGTSELTVWELASLASVTSPDTESSAGAEFLRSVEDGVRDALRSTDEYAQSDDWASDTASEIADQAVPIYTHQLWATFLDLAAYGEVEEVQGMGYEAISLDEPEKLPSVCLFVIAERLATLLLLDQIDPED